MANELTPHLEALKRAKAAGDEEAVAIIRQNLITAQQAMDQAQGFTSPVAGRNFGQNLREGVGQGMTNVVRHAGNLVGLESDEALAEAKALDKPLMNTWGGRVGNMIGEAAITTPATMGAGSLIGRAGALGARVMSNPISRGVAEGAMQGYVMGDPGQRGASAMIGGAVGGILPAAYAGVRRAIRGVNPTPEAQMLMERGVDLTPGQMNPRGVMNKLEQAYEQAPVVGEAIRGAREGAKQQWQREVIEQGIAPGSALTSASHDVSNLLDDAARTFDTAYDAAKGFPVRPTIMTTGRDVPLTQAFGQAVRDRSVMAPNSARRSVESWLQDRLTSLPRNASSDDLLSLRSMIRTQAREVGGDTLEQRATRDLLRNAETRVTQALESQLPRDAMTALRATDNQYANFAIIREAVAKAKMKPGGFTPFNFAQAVSEATDKSTFARGGGRMADLARAARATFESTEPKTGLLGWGTLGGTALGMKAAPGVVIPMAAGAAGLIGTRTGRRIAAGATRPQMLAQMLEQQVQTRIPQGQRELLAAYARNLMLAGQRLPRREEQPAQ